MKKFFAIAATAAMASMAIPVKAEPLWAWSFANQHCDGLRAGLTWKQSMQLATEHVWDLYRDEVEINSDRGVYGKLIVASIDKMCPYLEQQAWDEHKRSNP